MKGIFVFSFCCFFSSLFSQSLYNSINDSLLFERIKKCDLKGLKEDKLFNIDAVDLNNANLLMYAVYYCDLITVKYLVENGVPVKDSGVIYTNSEKTSYYGSLSGVAAGLGKIDILNFLVSKFNLSLEEKEFNPSTRKNDGWTALQWAVAEGKKEAVNYLISKLTKINESDATGETPLLLAIEKSNFEIARILISKKAYEFGDKADYLISRIDSADNVIRKDSTQLQFQIFSLLADFKREFYGLDHNVYHNSLYTLGQYYFYVSREYQKVIPLFKEILERSEKTLGSNHKGYAGLCNRIAICYQNLNDKINAEFYFLKAINIFKTFNNEDYSLVLANLGKLYFDYKEYEKAEQYYSLAKDLKENLGIVNDGWYTQILNQSGMVYVHLKKYKTAEEYFRSSLKIDSALYGVQSSQVAAIYNNLGTLYYNMRNFTNAEKYLLLALSLQQNLQGNHFGSGQLYSNLGSLFSDLGQYEKGESYLKEALKIYERDFGKLSYQYASVNNGLGRMYQRISEYKKAEQHFLNALEIYEKLGVNDIEYAQACSDLAFLYSRDEFRKFELSKRLCFSALQIARKTSANEELTANTYFYLGVINHDLNMLDSAEYYLKKSINILEKYYNKNQVQYNYESIELANVYWSKNKLSKSQKVFEELLNAEKKHSLKMFEFTSEAEKFSFINNMFHTSNVYQSFYFQNRTNINLKESYNLSLFKKGIVLNSLIGLKKIIYNSKDDHLIKKFKEWNKLKDKQSKLISIKSENIEDLKLLNDSIDFTEKELNKQASIIAGEENKIGFDDVRNSLKENEVAIEFLSFDYINKQKRRRTDSVFYVALILKNNTQSPIMVPLFEKAELEALLSYTGNKTKTINIGSLYRGISDDEFTAPTKNIYELIWKPIEKHLKGINKIYFSPDGLLHKISFAALPIGNGKVLSDQYRLNQLSTTANLVKLSKSKIGYLDKIILYGDIHYNADSSELKRNAVNTLTPAKNTDDKSIPDGITRGNIWENLSGTKEEIEGIKKQVSSYSKVLINSGSSATEESFKALDGDSSINILHIATHGFFFPDPGTGVKFNGIDVSGRNFKFSGNPLFRSGLLFAGANHAWQNKPVNGIEDGILTAYEISNMYFPNTKLVVLSACETALGDIQRNEGVYGLQRAFKMAGAENLIMSLWKVPDAETSEMMQELYKHLFKGSTIEDAFHTAQTYMKNKYRKDPYVWAGWILVN